MEKLDRILESYAAGASAKPGKNELLGVAFVVVDKNGILYQGARGRNSTRPESPKFAVDSVCWVASLTKLVTATCAMQLVQKGLLGLDDDVRPLVPQLADVKVLSGFVGDDIPVLQPNIAPITLRQLLLHTAGFAYGNGDPDMARWTKYVGRNHGDLDGKAEQWNTPLKFPPGQGWYYGTNIDWAGQVIERVTGKTLGKCMSEYLFEPLGMKDTTFQQRALSHARDRLVPVANRDSDSGHLTSSDDYYGPVDPEAESGGAGLYTTASDYSRLLQALLRALAGEHGGPVSQETAAEMLRPQLTDKQRYWLQLIASLFYDGMAADFLPGAPLDHGLSGAINTTDSSGKRRKGSMMWAGMCNAHWFLDPASGIGATLVTNILPHPDKLVTKIWDELERAVYSELLVPSSD
ncbi:beta-lactamase/transpeptidase-like protein [Coniella lustricola]|uniref:Beta-lactamase/transpeptidase-like protein n=1 Tax=Coniella lustricola TaxID=2025994 RepID=A0A2T3A514_9PEZI|nr:beta-lactamase/transpeptidase-like protein [Coniella lustricola]